MEQSKSNNDEDTNNHNFENITLCTMTHEKLNKCVQIVPPPEVSVVGLAGRYGFGALPRTRNVDIAPVHQTPWQLLPEKNEIFITI